MQHKRTNTKILFEIISQTSTKPPFATGTWHFVCPQPQTKHGHVMEMQHKRTNTEILFEIISQTSTPQPQTQHGHVIQETIRTYIEIYENQKKYMEISKSD